LHQKHFASSLEDGKSPEKGKNSMATTDRQTISFICSAGRLSSLPTRKWNEDFVVLVKKAGEADPVYRRAMEAAGPREAPQDGRKARKEILEIKDGLLYRKGMLWISEDKDLINTVLESEHDTKIAGHMGQDKTIELLRGNVWWPKMDE
jgi:hypothetical protein